MYLKKLKIGNVELNNNVILAPMAGITDLAFRKICKDCGAGLVETEMVSAKAIYYNDEKTLKMINTDGEKRPISIQIFGNEPEIMAEAAKFLQDKADIIDINMGCPAPKVVKNGDGSKLLQNLDLVGCIVEEVVKASSVPVTVKIRKGFNKSNVSVEAAKIIEQAGASMITIHGRTRDEYFSGDVDLDAIKKVKEAVHIPVIGNGNIVDEESALKMFEYTGVDGIMIGRGAMGNPWIFHKIIHYLQTGEKLEKISNKQKLETIIKHIELVVEEKGERVGIPELRKHLACYTKNLQDASKVRVKINGINTKEELRNYIEKLVFEKVISEQDKKYINVSRIYNFLNSKIGKELKEAKKIFREYEFILMNKDISNSLIQGVIDLFYVTKEDKVVLVDFKTDRIDNEEEFIKKYKIQ